MTEVTWHAHISGFARKQNLGTAVIRIFFWGFVIVKYNKGNAITSYHVKKPSI